MNMALADGRFQMIKMGYVQPAVAETEHLMVIEKWKLRGFNGDRINSSAMALCPNLAYSIFIIILMGKMIETNQSGCDFDGQTVLRISWLGWMELDLTSPTERPGELHGVIMFNLESLKIFEL